MQESIVFCSACMISLRKFTFAISSPDEFLVIYSRGGTQRIIGKSFDGTDTAVDEWQS